jgi:DNA-binding MarR family transcriptional regulator
VSAAPSEDRLTLDQQVCFSLTLADRRVVAVYRPFLEPLSLTHPQYLVMVALWEHAPLPMRDLARRLVLDSGTLSPLVGRLEAAGLLVRQRGRDDRSLTVALTPAGVALRQRARSVPGDVLRRLGIAEERLDELHAALRELIEATYSAPGE